MLAKEVRAYYKNKGDQVTNVVVHEGSRDKDGFYAYTVVTYVKPHHYYHFTRYAKSDMSAIKGENL